MVIIFVIIFTIDAIGLFNDYLLQYNLLLENGF
jgi:hypothetical protein